MFRVNLPYFDVNCVFTCFICLIAAPSHSLWEVYHDINMVWCKPDFFFFFFFDFLSNFKHMERQTHNHDTVVSQPKSWKNLCFINTTNNCFNKQTLLHGPFTSFWNGSSFVDTTILDRDMIATTTNLNRNLLLAKKCPCC